MRSAALPNRKWHGRPDCDSDLEDLTTQVQHLTAELAQMTEASIRLKASWRKRSLSLRQESRGEGCGRLASRVGRDTEDTVRMAHSCRTSRSQVGTGHPGARAASG